MDQETIKLLQKAGQIAAHVRRETAAKLAQPGTSFLQALDLAEELILKLGGEIAWAQMGVNETAAHFCPTDEDTGVSKEGDLIKVDIGVHLQGWIADNAMSVVVGAGSNWDNRDNGGKAGGSKASEAAGATAETAEQQALIKASRNALKAALKLVRPGVQLWELGEAQYSEAEALGFTTVKNLCGHTLERYKVHAGISIPTYNNKDKTELQEDWQIAIEPFVTNGQGYIKEKQPATVFMIEKEKGVRSPYAKKIMEEMKGRKTLPFTTRWLTRRLGKGVVLGLRELQQMDILRSYPPLVEISGGLVAQFEHAAIVKDKPIVYTRHEEDEW